MKRTALGVLLLLAALLLVLPAQPAQAQGGRGDKWVTGGSYTLASGERLDGNLLIAGGSATLESGSVVDGDVTIMGGSASVSAEIDGDVTLWGGSLRLGDGARVRGDVTRIGGSVSRAPGAVVEGRMAEGFNGPGFTPRMPVIPFSLPGIDTPRQGPDEPFGALGRFIGWQLVTVGWGVLMVLLAVVAVLLLPTHVQRIATAAAREPGMAFVLGVVTIILAALAGAVLLIACGLGLLVWLAGLLAMLAGWIAIGLWLGQRVLQALKMRQPSSLLEVGLGVLIITVLARIPCIGFLFWLVFASIGVGAVVMTRFGIEPRGPAWRGDAGRGPGGGPGRATIAPQSSVVPPAGPSVREDFVPDPPDLQHGPAADTVAPAAVVPPPAEANTAGVSVPLFEDDELDMIIGIGPVEARRLRDAGITSLADVASSDPATLARLAGVDEELVLHDDWIGQARIMRS